MAGMWFRIFLPKGYQNSVIVVPVYIVHSLKGGQEYWYCSVCPLCTGGDIWLIVVHEVMYMGVNEWMALRAAILLCVYFYDNNFKW